MLSRTLHRFLWFSLGAFSIFSFDGPLGMLITVMPLFFEKLQVDEIYLGIPLFVFGLCWALNSIVISIVFKRFNRRKIFLLLAYVLLIAMSLNILFLSNFIQFTIVLGLLGIGEAIVWQIALLLVSELYSPSSQAIYNGYLFASFNLATIIAPILSSFLYDAYGSFGFALVLLIFSSIGFILVCCIPEHLSYHSISIPNKFHYKLLYHPAIISSILLSFISAGIRASFETILPLLLRDKFQIQPKYIGLFYLCITIPATLLCLCTGHLSHKFSELSLLVIGLLFSYISYGCLLFSNSIPVFIIGLLSLAISYVCCSTPIPSFLLQAIHLHPSATHGLFNLFTALGISLYPLVSAYLYTSPLVLFILLSSLSSIALLALLWTKLAVKWRVSTNV